SQAYDPSPYATLIRSRRPGPPGASSPSHADETVLSLNTVCPYYTMFPLEFPLARLARAKPGEWVLDPFCGRGTTMYAARLRGLRSEEHTSELQSRENL